MRFLRWLTAFTRCELGGGGRGGADASILQQQQEEERKKKYREQVNSIYDDPKHKLAAEELSGGLRSHYGTELGTAFEKAKQAAKFRAADTGNIGGSTYADELAELEEQNQRGGLRIEDAVRRAVANLDASREDSRARALSLVNAGTGEEAVRAAQAGIQSAIDTSRTAGREDLVSDLFSTVAAGKVAGDAASRDASTRAIFEGARSRPLRAGETPSSGGRILKG